VPDGVDDLVERREFGYGAFGLLGDRGDCGRHEGDQANGERSFEHHESLLGMIDE
jgi:hypothetical protein